MKENTMYTKDLIIVFKKDKDIIYMLLCKISNMLTQTYKYKYICICISDSVIHTVEK